MFTQFRRLTVTALVMLSLGACGGGDDTTGPDDQGPSSLSIALGNQGRATVLAGSSASVPISIVRGGSYSSAVTINPQGLPTGVTAAALVLTPAQTSGNLILTADASAPRTAVAVSVGVTGSGGGLTSGTVFLTLSVTRP